MLERLLEKLGLSEKEAKVYLATLELGQDTVQNIAKKASVQRPTAYVILEKLMTTGLVSTVQQGKKTLFVAESPKELQNLLEEQKHQIDMHRQELDDAMGQFMAIHNASGDKPVVRYFEGEEGLVALDRYGHDQFPPGKEILGIMPIDLIEEQFPKRREEAMSDRVKRRIPSRIIYTHRDGPFPEEVNKKQLRNAVFISREKLPIDVTLQIYPEWGVKFYNFQPGKHFGVLMQSEQIAKNMQAFFELAWLGAKKEQ